jgi:hypothetical protein
LTFSQQIDSVVGFATPWKEPNFALGDASFWMIAIFVVMLAIAPEIGIPIEVGTAAGVGAVMGAGISELSYSLEPE